MPKDVGKGAERVLEGCLTASVSDRWDIAMVDEVGWSVGWRGEDIDGGGVDEERTEREIERVVMEASMRSVSRKRERSGSVFSDDSYGSMSPSGSASAPLHAPEEFECEYEDDEFEASGVQESKTRMPSRRTSTSPLHSPSNAHLCISVSRSRSGSKRSPLSNISVLPQNQEIIPPPSPQPLRSFASLMTPLIQATDVSTSPISNELPPSPLPNLHKLTRLSPSPERGRSHRHVLSDDTNVNGGIGSQGRKASHSSPSPSVAPMTPKDGVDGLERLEYTSFAVPGELESEPGTLDSSQRDPSRGRKGFRDFGLAAVDEVEVDGEDGSPNTRWMLNDSDSVSPTRSSQSQSQSVARGRRRRMSARTSTSRSRSNDVSVPEAASTTISGVDRNVNRGRRAGSTPPFTSGSTGAAPAGSSAPGTSPRGWILSRRSSHNTPVSAMSKVVARGSVSVSPERERERGWDGGVRDGEIEGGMRIGMRRGLTERGTAVTGTSTATGVLRGVRSRSVDRWGA